MAIQLSKLPYEVAKRPWLKLFLSIILLPLRMIGFLVDILVWGTNWEEKQHKRQR